MSKLLKPGDRVLHVGAHHAEERGLYARCSRVLWVEADPAMYPRLEKLGVEFVAAAASDRVGEATLHRFTVSGANSLLKRGPVVETDFNGKPILEVDGVRVPTVTVDSLGYEYDVLVIDVQGHEAAVLRGAAESIKRCRVVYLELLREEYYEGQASLDELLRLLHEFQLTGADEEGPGWSNLAFVRR